MPPLQSLMAPRTRGSRKAARGPKTPEPFATTDIRPPSPPRPRFRLRRRAPSSNLKAPTQQFLASVATADVPIPSIEEPRLLDEDMVDTLSTSFPQFNPYHLFPDDGDLPRGRTSSPPKTPAPHAIPSLSPKRFPNWSLDQAYSSLESSPECDSRPSTAQSTQTSSSLFSRYSLNSDNLSQYSIDADDIDQLGPSSIEDGSKTIKPIRAPTASSRRSRKAPWTRSMSQHLWSVYMTYLQDPHVTPFHIPKSGIPPHGVCMRVAREAKRSWKGPKSQQADHSGSATPTVEAAPTSYVQWPHSCAATRAHLRELCKASATSAARNHRYMGRNPTPFGRTANRVWNRRMAPSRSQSAFSGNDMALSLAVSTCESMQPHGPLAQLTGSQDQPSMELFAPPTLIDAAAPAPGSGAAGADITRLGSPFVARSYGPSASNSLADSFGMSLEPQGPISSSVGTRRRSLGSPARLSNSRGSNQKRRSKQSVAVEPRRKRPSLGSDFWVDPSNDGASTQATPSAEFSSTASTQRDALFIPRTNLQELFEASHPPPSLGPSLAPPLAGAPVRLGSPFSAAKASFSFPGRRSASISTIDFSIIRRPFATVQQPIESESTSPKSSLRSRLAYIDERLKDFRRRDHPRRRSQSPA
ncbi:uncharacterized protein TRIVIDRAFT_43320 [Trichoderma virens Gv29-8]|uniref:Uncharacterized protein n=1 Tax=Hypocrea virens (strain Gv29-8 / FGSC 10586) TaxID=413071 RepID=G9N6Y0_HYPVG|nr:uncharacterized protein TRIVIDRAFT_43320 [Trichoderma virens Gv29-8]EHK17479.1 hypothetical protein TRIVIDRAFT_43320 [Trichoderma virens Gv29-8]